MEQPKVYKAPQREIFTIDDMPKWTKSEAYQEYIGFVVAMNEAIKGKKISDVTSTSPNIDSIYKLLEKLDVWVDEIPPIQQPQRFGNKAFQTWYEKLKKESEEILKEALPEEFHPAVLEIRVYLTEGFGNSTRVDYGTGHEMAFAMFLCCLFKIEALKQEDSVAAIFKIFNRYTILMRKLQTTYRMEPAGSHGVWSLDDYHFLPFVWGSSQLIGHPRLEPKSFPNEGIGESFAKDYMFMACIAFINKVKTGPFAEHSNQLWNISGVPSWTKVNAGLLKMYKAEVLGKFPVIQHTLFGSLLPIKVQNLQAT